MLARTRVFILLNIMSLSVVEVEGTIGLICQFTMALNGIFRIASLITIREQNMK